MTFPARVPAGLAGTAVALLLVTGPSVATAPAAAAATVPVAATAPSAESITATQDGPDRITLTDERITESSGLAVSASHPDVLWTHNDSDDGAQVFAVDGRDGDVLATVTLEGVQARDWEAITVGEDVQGRPTVFVADIGDNFGGGWSEVWLYSFTEPSDLGEDVTVEPVRYTVQYEDGPRDAEAAMFDPVTGRLWIASKENGGAGGLYVAPPDLVTGATNTFTRVADIPGLTVTDGAFSPDGSRLALRGYFEVAVYQRPGGTEPGAELERLGRPQMPFQRQGESLAFTPDGRALLLGSEGERSPVQRVDLDGELLPDSARAEDAAEEEAADAGGAAGDGGAAAPSGAAAEDGAAAGDASGTIPTGLVVVAIVAVLLLTRRRRPRQE
ncbi:hypothetical protein [Allostreptomyces psammosilenae]|uniref:WD40 repeat domain-containing protein n=1 Tax=Allostreptomyces psammosilenae TaxID=1892865 RepID=A0A853A4B0_9ACTN|nr:hypothetical protein [Allostreptomyces psammosilenae]NYI07714.1 hypothetical protein [Allostreptomyces psammosilenae]